MAEIVFAAGVPHLGGIITGIKQAGEQGTNVQRVYDDLSAELRAAQPQALIIFGSDHFKSFFMNHAPRFCVGVGPRCTAWDEGVLPREVVETWQVPLHQHIARDDLYKAVERGFDLNASEELRLDHSFYAPIERLVPEHDVPIVPIVVNVAMPPRPPFRRCYQLGQAIGQIVADRPAAERVAVIGTGGLSHSVGSPDYGRVNGSMDQEFMDLLANGRAEEILDHWSPDWVEEAGGNGMNEIRMWLALAGVVAGARGCVLLYQEMPVWNCGIGFLQFDPRTAQIPVGAK